MLFNTLILVLGYLVLTEEVESGVGSGYPILFKEEIGSGLLDTAEALQKCTLEDNTEGVCIHINNCTTALNNIKNNIKPKICEFDHLDPIVCCERSSIKVPDVILTCTLEDKTEGVCIPATYCPSAYKNNKKRQICYYEHIACCEKSSKLIDVSTKHATELTDVSTTCILKKDNTRGSCVPMENCPEAIKDFRNHKRIKICHLNTYKPFVCCKNPSTVIEVGAKSTAKCFEHNYKLPYYGVPVLLGGTDSLSKEFPHMAILGFGTETDVQWACGGSLISKKFVLTAAHCLHPPLLGEVNFVRLGDLDIASTIDNAEPQDLKVVSRIKHPHYKPPLKYHDIGLIEVNGPIQMTTYIKPACLQISNDISESRWIVTGWGTLSYEGSHQADHLQKAEIKKFSYETCKKFYRSSKRQLNRGIDNDIQICAGEEHKDTCRGDSGGPLQIKNNNTLLEGYTIIGVTSFGKACGIMNSPSVYTRVSNYIGWIEPIVWPK